MHISLRLLGNPQVQIDDETIAESRAKRIEAMLYYLAVEAQHSHRRETLVGLLFPDMPDDTARTNLRQTLRRLRNAIDDEQAEPPFLIASRESTQFNLACDHFIDVARFEALLRGCEQHAGRRDFRCAGCMAQAAEATDLYHGPFLDGFFLEDSAEFDNWLLSHRERLQQLALDALEELANYHEQRGDYVTAVPFARRQIDLEPWREEAYQQLMRLLAYLGKRADALRLYEKLREQLELELGVDPLPESEAIYDRLTRTADQRPYSLPPRDPGFVGRQEELGLIQLNLVDPGRRLLTLVATGGTGKTAAAVETGWRVADSFLGPFSDGVFFVPLAGIAASDGEQPGYNPIVTAVAETLGLPLSGPQSAARQVIGYVRDKSLLLIFDNFEHVIHLGRGFVQQLLQGTRDVNILVTSRERLRLPEEWVVELQGLPVDDDEALALFEQRAARVLPGFTLVTAGPNCTAADVRRICALVNGLPLGIELAASWARILTCFEIAAEIEQNLDFLQSTLYDDNDRHQSLRAVFAYSWELLTPAERDVLARIAVFQGQFDREAATAVAGANLPQLSALVDRSLLQHQASDSGHSRYVMLEVLRQYAREQLAHSDSRDDIQAVHGRYYLDFVRQQEPGLIGAEQQAAQAAIVARIENIRAAWRHATAAGMLPELDSAAPALGLFYYMHSWFDEGHEMFAQASSLLAQQIRQPDAPALATRVYGKCLTYSGWFAFLSGRQQAGHDILFSAVSVLRGGDDAVARGYALSYLAVATYTLASPAAAEPLAQEALDAFTAADYAYGRAIANNILSQIAFQRQAYASAQRYSETSLHIERALGNRWSMGFSLVNLGRVALAAGDLDVAEARFREGLAIREALYDLRGQALCCLYLGDTAVARQDSVAAAAAYAASHAFFEQLGSGQGMATVHLREGDLAAATGDAEAAADHYRRALETAREHSAMPHVLAAVIRLAALQADDNPRRAGIWATVVLRHTAVDDDTRARAKALLAYVGPVEQVNPRLNLDIIVSRLLDG